MLRSFCVGFVSGRSKPLPYKATFYTDGRKLCKNKKQKILVVVMQLYHNKDEYYNIRGATLLHGCSVLFAGYQHIPDN